MGSTVDERAVRAVERRTRPGAVWWEKRQARAGDPRLSTTKDESWGEEGVEKGGEGWKGGGVKRDYWST